MINPFTSDKRWTICKAKHKGREQTSCFCFSLLFMLPDWRQLPAEKSRAPFLSSHSLMTLSSNFQSHDRQPTGIDCWTVGRTWPLASTESLHGWQVEKPWKRNTGSGQQADRLAAGQWRRWTWRAPVDSRSTSWLIEIPLPDNGRGFIIICLFISSETRRAADKMSYILWLQSRRSSEKILGEADCVKQRGAVPL